MATTSNLLLNLDELNQRHEISSNNKQKLFDDILELPSTFSPKCRNVMSVIYYFVYVGITVACYNISVNIRVINGAIFGFFIVYLFPSILHLQCINRKLSSSFISSDKN